MKKKRLIYELRWHKTTRMWRLTIRGAGSESWGTFGRKAACEAHARHRCRNNWENLGQPCQLLIYNKNGRIGKGGRSEASYGCDSKRRKG